MLDLQPVDERLFIKPEKQEIYKGLIIIPDTVREEKQLIGKVIAVGDDNIKADVKRKKLSELVKVGDRVVYTKYGGSELEVDGEDYQLIKRSEVLAVVIED